MPEMIYLDNSTATRLSDQAREAMLPFLTKRWGAPSAPYAFGQELLAPMEKAYRSLYNLLGAEDEDTILFTSSGAEAVNQVIHGVYHDVSRLEGKNHFITSRIDEAPAIMAIGRLEEMGARGQMAEVTSDGTVTAQAVAEAMSPRTALVSLSWANGLTGVIHPIEEIAEVCQERGVLLHVDATHLLPSWEVNVQEIGAHFVTFNGDQLHGPKGTGALYIKKGTKLSSLIQGGMEQGGGRAGAVNIPALVALGIAADELQENRDFLAMEGARLRDKFEKDLMKAYPECVALFSNSERLSTISVMAFQGISNDALMHALNEEGIYACFGGGCFQRIALVLQAIGVDSALSHTAISFSLSHETSEEEIYQAVQGIAECATKLRNLSKALL
jgi:cysteine desulfurase